MSIFVSNCIETHKTVPRHFFGRKKRMKCVMAHILKAYFSGFCVSDPQRGRMYFFATHFYFIQMSEKQNVLFRDSLFFYTDE